MVTPREQSLALLAGQVPPGRPFFRTAAQALAMGTGCRWAGVGELQEDGDTVELFAFWDRDRHVEPFTFRLPGSPCHEVYRSQAEEPHEFFPRNVAERFPEFPLLAEIAAQSYRGEVFYDRHGQPAGHVFVLGENEEEEDDEDIRDFFRLVSQRVGAEYNRWQAEEALESSERTLRWYENMVAAAGDQMAFIDRDYTYRAVNPSYLETIPPEPRADGTPWTRQNVVGRTFEEVRGPELFRIVKPDFDRCLAGHEVSFQRWFETPGRKRLYLKVSFRPYRAQDGSIQGLVVVLRDLTERRQQLALISDLTADEAVAVGRLDTAQRLITEAIATNLAVERAGLWLFDGDRRQLRCQALFTGSSRCHSGEAELREETIVTDRYPRYFEALRSGRTIAAHDVNSDRRMVDLSGGYFEPRQIVSVLDAPIRISGSVVGSVRLEHLGEPRIWQADEITFASEAAFLVAQTIMNRDRRLLESRLARTQKMESLGVLAGGIAHDFNNLLVGVLGGVDLALAELPPGTQARRYLDLASRSATRAAELCSQMLAYAGKGQFVLERIDLSEVLSKNAGLLKATFATRAELDFQLAEDLPAIEADVVQVRQIVTHLLTNAVEALPEGEGVVTLVTGSRFCRRSDLRGCLPDENLEAGQYVYLEVIDSGCGMDEATRARIFEPFFSTKFTGRGLGLAAVLGIVRSHGGRIKVRSSPGTGTSVRIYFPAQSQESRAGSSRDEQRSAGSAVRRILVVDDEEVVRTLVGEILQKAGYECLVAGGGRQGVEIFEQHADAIDLVLLDVTMPDLNGDQVLDRIHRLRREVPVVMVSGYSEQDLAERFAGRNVAAILHKPFHPGQLLEAVRQALEPEISAVSTD